MFLGLNDEDVIKALQSARRLPKAEPEEKKPSTDQDMENCFGFDVCKKLHVIKI